MNPQKSMRHKRSQVLKFFAAVILDIALTTGIVAGDYVYNYIMPQKLTSLNYQTIISPSPQSSRTDLSPSSTSPAKKNDSVMQFSNTLKSPWAEKFKDKFSDKVISTSTTYRSSNLSIELTYKNYDSKNLDYSENGKHLKYGSRVAYVLADIYISDISCLKTAFAKDTYGIGYSELLSSMSDNIKSVLSVNGDSYSNNRHKNNGTIIRNGMVYRSDTSTEETCVLYHDGTMKIYTPQDFNANQVVADGAWQTWVFGPSLLDANGNAKTKFITWDYIRQSHPRTAIGYYEPGHFCLLIVDGRKPGYSRGMYLEEMSKLFADLGCTAAYNLDGGHSSSMDMNGAVVSKPYKPSREVSDGIFICEPEVQK